MIKYKYDFGTPKTKDLYLILSLRQQASPSRWVFTVWPPLNKRQAPPLSVVAKETDNEAP